MSFYLQFIYIFLGTKKVTYRSLISFHKRKVGVTIKLTFLHTIFLRAFQSHDGDNSFAWKPQSTLQRAPREPRLRRPHHQCRRLQEPASLRGTARSATSRRQRVDYHLLRVQPLRYSRKVEVHYHHLLLSFLFVKCLVL